jgi:hypothetical protein
MTTTTMPTTALKAEIAGRRHWLKTYGSTGSLSLAAKRTLAALEAELASRSAA